jgi:hypothetical protein
MPVAQASTVAKPLFSLLLPVIASSHRPKPRRLEYHRLPQKMTNQKDARKRQGASQNLPNTHFQGDSLTDHDVLVTKTNVSKMSSGVFKTKTDVCVTNYKSTDPYG